MYIFIILYVLHIILQTNLLFITRDPNGPCNDIRTEITDDNIYSIITYIMFCIVFPVLIIFVSDIYHDARKTAKNVAVFLVTITFATIHGLMIFKEYHLMHTMIISMITMLSIPVIGLLI